MKTNRIQRAARICVLSTFLALAAFSFLAFGSASAHALTRSAQTASSSATTTVTTVRIIVNKQGATVFSPSTITIKSGSSVKIVNKTAFSKILFVGASGTVVRLASAASMTITPPQSEGVGICGGGGLSITVV